MIAAWITVTVVGLHGQAFIPGCRGGDRPLHDDSVAFRLGFALEESSTDKALRRSVAMSVGMKIGNLARATLCTVVTVRYYEREGLLPSSARSRGNYRLYGPAHVERSDSFAIAALWT